MREKRRQREFENRVLRRIFVPKRDEVTGELRKLYTRSLWSVLLTKYHSRDQIEKNEAGGVCNTYGGE